MALPTPVLIEDSSITSWEWIGRGGFGDIYKAKHPLWDYHVAIKLLRNDGGEIHKDRTSSLLREVKMMLQGSSEYVMQVLGVFIGRPPNSGSSEQLGLVMKYMEKGSLESLQEHLDGVPPLPLVFRLAHQVALGINFLHSLTPPILHCDLKPNNVLLDSDLNVKLTDFGLSKISQTQAQVSKTDKGNGAGTLRYMPPEAFDLNYKPSRAFDIYSYGILLWYIATGEKPYPNAAPNLMHLLIPKGHRPSLEELTVRAADQEELRGLVELMEKCWGGNPTQRPSSFECTKITEELYQRQKRGINDAVHEVLKKLEQKEQDKLMEDLQWLRVTPAKGSLRVEAANNQYHVVKGPPPVQRQFSSPTPYINEGPSERKRHPTSPSRVNPPSPHPGSRRNLITMELEGVPPPVIEDSVLMGWVSIGSGGFGVIYKAKHKLWRFDVAIKLLHNVNTQTHEKRIQALQREVQMMLLGSSEYVMQVLGIFNGRLPNSGPSAQLGLVMKYMENGSLESLQNTLDGVPPLPLVFRLAHQVALGINFLHNLPTPILHRDLKPSNVLLDSDLNVKLTDFGLSQASEIQALVSKKDLEEGAGTLNYMPPEAFDINYKPSRAFDIYSYGILLWSIATGEQPYRYRQPSVVMFLIPKGHRPSLEELTVRAADQEELRGLVELMVKCWGGNPTQRPSSLECTKITEELYERHEHGINDAVHEVLKKLREQKERDKLTEDLQSLRVTPAKGSLRVEAANNQYHVVTGPPPVQRQFSSPTPYINKEPSERKQQPTSPSRVNPPSPHPGSRRNLITMVPEVPPPVNMALSDPVIIGDSIVTDWVLIGSGGFGEIYKVKHPVWDYDVAIRLLRYYGGTRSSLMREVKMMLLGSNEYVMQVLSVFNGRPPNSGPSAQLGLVMKYMENGSLESLQKTLDGVPSLPLVFRLAHQVALGMNFLHSLTKVHHDLKPSNVLLDSDLNAKLTGFGLSKPRPTRDQVSKTDKVDGGGTINYMPPEAFELNYKPSRAFDIYSYGILLWSIATGKQPYPHSPPSLMQLLIAKGKRPSLDELTVRAADQAELSGLVELMVKCWVASPTQRPSSLDCTKITEKLYQTQKRGINDAVHEVLKKLREQKKQDRMT